MQLRPEQLPNRLQGQWAPLYLVCGDEPLQTGEASDRIRTTARKKGYTERIVLEADNRFDWALLDQYAESLPLFAEKRLLDLRLPAAGPGQKGGDALTRYAGHPNPTLTLLIRAGRLDPRQRKSRWYRSLDQAGVIVTVWPVDAGNLPRWIDARCRARNIQITPEAARLLAERVEGNLLACAQEIDKLALLVPERAVDERDVMRAVSDSARYETFDLVESTLSGDAGRTLRILRGLAEEGVDPLPILGLLAWEIRAMANVAHQMQAPRARLDDVLARQGPWQRRRQAVASALKHHRPSAWGGLLQAAEGVDRIIKGAETGNPWDALQGLALAIAGVAVVSPVAGITWRHTARTPPIP